MQISMIVGGAPAWVYVLLVVLIVLGIRRFRTRTIPIAVALIPIMAFVAWSGAGLGQYARQAGWPGASLVWVGGAVLGALSAVALAEPRGARLPGGSVRQPGSVLPLIMFVAVFVARFACGAWAAIEPAQAATATAVGLGVGAAMTGRMLTTMLRWRSSR